MLKRHATLLLLFVVSLSANAQQFIPAFHTFSKKKISYITLENGEQVKGNIKSIDRKKGLIEEIKIKTLEGKTKKIAPDDIKYMYLPPSGFDKFASSLSYLNDATQWDRADLDQDIIGKGYAYFEKSDVRIKKKTRTLLMQLLNPSYSNKVKVFFDPFAKETASIGVAGINVAGGLDKSYYIKKGDEIAYKLEKKRYDEEFPLLFEGCDALKTKDNGKPKWSDFESHVFTYAKECN